MALFFASIEIGEKFEKEIPYKSILKAFEIANYEIDVVAVSSFWDILPLEYVNKVDCLHFYNYFLGGRSCSDDFHVNRNVNNIYSMLCDNYLKNDYKIVS